MLFKKLFQVLVLGGAVAAGVNGCVASAQAQAANKKADSKDGGKAPDAGTAAPAESGGGVPGW